MSGLYSNTSNYGGRQPDNTSYIKQFVNTASGYANWVFKTINSIKYITPAAPDNVYLPKDLVVAGSIISPSDKELKENVDDLSNEFCDGLLELEPKQYVYKNDANKKIRYGFIAQDIENFYPELINEGDVYKSINYLDLIPIMIGKIKNMQEQIDELRVDKLRKELLRQDENQNGDGLKMDINHIPTDFSI